MQETNRGFKKPEDADNADLRTFVGDNMDKLETVLDSEIKGHSVAIGYNTSAAGYGTSVGRHAKSSISGIAVGESINYPIVKEETRNISATAKDGG